MSHWVCAMGLLVTGAAHASEPSAFAVTCQHLFGKWTGHIEDARPAARAWSDEQFLRFWDETTNLKFKDNPDRLFRTAREREGLPDAVVKKLRLSFRKTVVRAGPNLLHRIEKNLIRAVPVGADANEPAQIRQWQKRQRIYAVFRERDRVNPIGALQVWTEPEREDHGFLFGFTVRRRLFQRLPSDSWKLVSDVTHPMARMCM